MKSKYYAKLTGNRRDVETSSPKALIVFINPSDQLDRNHCWVELDMVEHMQPSGHKPPIAVEFFAELKMYKKRGTITSYTLTNITDMKRMA